MTQDLNAAVGAQHAVAADLAGLAASHAEGAVGAAVGQDAGGHGFQEADAAQAAVTAAPAPCTARARADLVAVQAHREAELQHLGVGQARVGHVGLHHAGAGKALARAGAAGHCLVVLVALVAKGEVVHGALAGRHDAQCTQQRIGDAGGGLHIARHHRRRRVGVEHGAGRDDDLQRLEAASVERNVVVHQRAKHIEHRRHADRGGRVEVVGLLGRGAGEINHRAALRRVHANGHANLGAIVQRQGELPVFQAGDDAAHRLFGVVLHMPHVGLHNSQPEMGHHLVQLLNAFFVGGNLGLEVGDVLRRVAGGIVPAGQQRQQLGLAQHALVNQLDVVDLHALLLDRLGKRRHGAGCGAAHIGMVAARAHVKRGTAVQINRGDDGNVRQVGAAVVGVVQHKHIPRLHAGGVVAHHGLDALAHGPQVHWHVRRVGDQVADGVEQRAAEIKPLLDIDRMRSVLQLQAHLLGDVHEQVVEHFQQHRVDRGACSQLREARAAPLQHQVVQRRQARLPTGLDHGGGVFLGNHGRTDDQVTGLKVFAHQQGGGLPLAVGVHAHGLAHSAAGLQVALRVQRVAWLGRGVAGQHRFDRDGLHHQGLALHQERKTLAVGGFKIGLDLCQRIARCRPCKQVGAGHNQC